MKEVLLPLVLLVFLSSCAAPAVMMVHPGSQQAVMCKTWGVGIIQPIAAIINNHRCVEQARQAGFVRAGEYGSNRDYWQNPYRGWRR